MPARAISVCGTALAGAVSGRAATGLLSERFGSTWIVDICEFGVFAVAWALACAAIGLGPTVRDANHKMCPAT
jgi:hypothetical protein